MRVEDSDYLSVNVDGVGNPDEAGQARVDALGHGCLARARRARYEERAARVDDAAHRLYERLRQYEVAESRAHGLNRGGARRHGLKPHHVRVVAQGDGRGADVAAQLAHARDALPAALQHLVARRADGDLPLHLNHLLALEVYEHLLDERARQT